MSMPGTVSDVARGWAVLCCFAQRPEGAWATVSAMYPNIAPCLVLPFEKSCQRGSDRYEALVFAQRGGVVLFAAEHTREFGVGILDGEGRMCASDHFPTLDLAARRFLAHESAGA